MADTTSEQDGEPTAEAQESQAQAGQASGASPASAPEEAGTGAPEATNTPEAASADQDPDPKAELAKDLEEREGLVEEAEKVAASQDWRHGSSDLRRLQDRWADIRRWHDPAEDELFARFGAARKAFYDARDEARGAAKDAKEKLAAEAEKLATSTSWNKTSERLRQMMDEWKAAGRTGDDAADDALWKRFNDARQAFYERRSKHFEELDKQHEAAKQTKEQLIEEARTAAVTASDWTGDQWRAASQRMRDLMDRWKAAGVASKADNDRLWEEFRAARQPFFDAQHAHYDELDAARKKAADAKRALIEQAKALADGSDFGREAAERAKQLDRDWKKVGYAGRELNDKLWDAFNEAKERFWDERRSYNDERHQEWKERLQGAIERRQQRLGRLQEQVDRLQDRINNAYATDHVEEMQEDLEDRKKTVEEIKAEIADMKRRLDE